MTEKTTNNKENITSKNSILFFATSIMCILILIVSFIAFRNIENTAHAVTVLFSGVILDLIIFINGTNKQ